jgi:hypothetical protein
MTSHGKARPLLMIAAIAALAVGITACNSGGSSPQYSYDPPNSGYSNVGSSNAGSGNVGSNPNEAGSLYWQNQAAQNLNSASSDMGPGGVADPADQSNPVSNSGDGTENGGGS